MPESRRGYKGGVAMAEYETIIGMEVHAELSTESKVFCKCSTKFGGAPNTQTCPVCLGMPGSLPVLNEKAVEYTIKAALALNCEIAPFSKFDRKNYFYPDLPKGYQISQYDLPIGRNGYIDIEVNGVKRRIRIRRVHLEEETGKSLHEADNIAEASYSLMDYNRAGIPLIEIVTEPDIRSAEEAKAYLIKLRNILHWIGVSDCKMEEGSLRCEANVSLRPKGSSTYGPQTELKNIASFRAVQRAIEYEEMRHLEIYRSGGTPRRETRHWDDVKGVTVFMRSKEQAHDYRYFPEPDLVPLVIDSEWVERIKRSLPELPDAKRKRFVREYGLPEYDADQITSSRSVTQFFEECVAKGADPKTVSNWIMGEVFRMLNQTGKDLAETALKAEHLLELLGLVDSGTISITIAKKVFEDVFSTGKSPKAIVEEQGLAQISDEGKLREIARQVIEANPQPVQDYKAGKERALGFLVGQVMKATKGRANPQAATQILKEELGK